VLQGFSSEELAHAYRYLANYHLKANQLEKAYYSAQKCTEFFEVFCCDYTPEMTPRSDLVVVNIAACLSVLLCIS